VFTHGYGDDSSTWTHQIECLSRAWSTVTWDLRAHGSSPMPADGPLSRDLALDDLRRVAGEEPSVLVGHSFGGYLSLLLAIERPDLVRALVLVATGPGFRDPAAREAWNDLARRVAAKMSPPREAATMLMQRDAVVIDNLHTITVPVLHIVGERDVEYHAGHEHLQRALPDARSAIVPGAKHHPHRDAPDAVNPVIVAFLEGLPPFTR
jgi:pimeloyl-ACP methyl ester carboxylesterase